MNELTQYTAADHAALIGRLHDLAEQRLAEFHKKLIPGGGVILGVKMPALHKIAKEICRADWRGFLRLSSGDTHEETMLRGIVIGSARCSIDERFELLRGFIPSIRNWAACDMVCSSVSLKAPDRDEMWRFILPYTSSPSEFEQRFALVMMLGEFLREPYFGDVLRIYKEVSHEGYYVRMAAAWGLAEAYLRFPSEVKALLESGHPVQFIQNKTIQKICESRRVSAEEKALLRVFKRRDK